MKRSGTCFGLWLALAFLVRAATPGLWSINPPTSDRNPTGYPQVMEDRNPYDLTLVHYTYGLDLISRTRDIGNTEGRTRYYGYDGLGSVRYLTDASGAVTDTYTYDAFGILIETRALQSGSLMVVPSNSSLLTPNSYKYTGEHWDTDLGMYYLRARWYKPEIGRFWTMDSYEGNSSDPLSLHKYLYCHGNPVSNTDPSGNETLIGVSIASTIGTSLHAMYDGGALAVQQSLQATIFGVQRGYSAKQILIGYYTDIAIGVGIGIAAGKALQFVDDLIYGGGINIGSAACFVAGTLVATSEGLEPIEQIKVGDSVWSWSESTGDFSLQSVVNTMRREARELVAISLDSGTITTTPEHPFWIHEKGWTPALGIKVGDNLLQRDGTLCTVSNVARRVESAPVFNLEVESNHTYLVGPGAVVVHNLCPWGQRAGSLPAKPGVYVLKDKGGKLYVGRADNLNARLTSSKHKHADIIRDPSSEVATFELDTSQLAGGNVDEALRVAEEYFKRAMNTNAKGRGSRSGYSPDGLNESREISDRRYEDYINQHGFPPIGEPVSH